MVKLRFVDFVFVNTFLTKNTKEDMPSHVIGSHDVTKMPCLAWVTK